MISTNPETNERISALQQDVHPYAVAFFRSDFGHAAVGAVATIIAVAAMLIGVFDYGFDILPRVIGGVTAVAFLLVAFARYRHIRALQFDGLAAQLRHQVAIAEAQAEIKLHRDLNNSGAIGDMVEGELERRTTEDLRKFVRHLDEFWELIENKTRRMARDEDWLAHKGLNGMDVPAFQFRDGERITREEYDLFCRVATTMRRWGGRRRGVTGEILPPAPVGVDGD